SGHAAAVGALAFSPDGQKLASADVAGEIRLWSLAGGAPIGVLTGHKAGVRGLAFAPDGGALASASLDQTVRLWFLRNLALASLPRFHRRAVRLPSTAQAASRRCLALTGASSSPTHPTSAQGCGCAPTAQHQFR